MEYVNASVLMNRLQAKARMRHLQVLVTLGELRSLKKTAESIGLSQPAVTQLLADLESLLEVKLFDRFSRGTQPTRAGRELIPVAQRILEALAHGSEAISALRRQGEGSVRIAAIAGAISGLLSRAIPEFTLAHPSIQRAPWIGLCNWLGVKSIWLCAASP
jgi:DNA-binding transcriptional LysR family regulator